MGVLGAPTISGFESAGSASDSSFSFIPVTLLYRVLRLYIKYCQNGAFAASHNRRRRNRGLRAGCGRDVDRDKSRLAGFARLVVIILSPLCIGLRLKIPQRVLCDIMHDRRGDDGAPVHPLRLSDNTKDYKAWVGHGRDAAKRADILVAVVAMLRDLGATGFSSHGKVGHLGWLTGAISNHRLQHREHRLSYLRLNDLHFRPSRRSFEDMRINATATICDGGVNGGKLHRRDGDSLAEGDICELNLRPRLVVGRTQARVLGIGQPVVRLVQQAKGLLVLKELIRTKAKRELRRA